MTPITPIQQPVLEDIRNAAAIANLWALADGMEPSPIRQYREVIIAFTNIDRLLRHAIEGLSEPSLAAVQAAAAMLREANGSYDNDGHIDPRAARDTAAVILKAAVTGQVPPTWEDP